jgi:hypothetical protein
MGRADRGPRMAHPTGFDQQNLVARIRRQPVRNGRAGRSRRRQQRNRRFPCPVYSQPPGGRTYKIRPEAMTPQRRLVLVSAPQAAAMPASPQAVSRGSGGDQGATVRASLAAASLTAAARPPARRGLLGVSTALTPDVPALILERGGSTAGDHSHWISARPTRPNLLRNS